MDDLINILRCPVSHRPLTRVSDHELVADGGGLSYRIQDGIPCLLPSSGTQGSFMDERVRRTQEFYESGGWERQDDGLFGETKAFADTRSVAQDFSGKCITRLQRKYLRKRGTFLLDAGSGPVPRPELLTNGHLFTKRLCLDLSGSALRVARGQLGDAGEYVQGDMTNLPLKDDSIDAITCNHVIYQIPAEYQIAAFKEIWRVLKPGGVAIVVYLWAETPLHALKRALRGQRRPKHGSGQAAASAAAPDAELVHEPLTLSWFAAQQWPFRYTIDCFRMVNNNFMKNHVSDDWRGRTFLNALYMLQTVAPGLCGRLGVMPAIIIRK
jgi:SAM-dependent methyltransferase/uncharacterized protein YbaR (Trm112 family)